MIKRTLILHFFSINSPSVDTEHRHTDSKLSITTQDRPSASSSPLGQNRAEPLWITRRVSTLRTGLRDAHPPQPTQCSQRGPAQTECLWLYDRHDSEVPFAVAAPDFFLRKAGPQLARTSNATPNIPSAFKSNTHTHTHNIIYTQYKIHNKLYILKLIQNISEHETRLLRLINCEIKVVSEGN